MLTINLLLLRIFTRTLRWSHEKKNVTLSAKIRFIHHHSQFSIWQFNLNVHANPRKFNSLVQKVQLTAKCSLLISPKRIYFTNEQREGNTKGSLKSKKCKQKCHAMQDFKGIIVLDNKTGVRIPAVFWKGLSFFCFSIHSLDRCYSK